MPKTIGDISGRRIAYELRHCFPRRIAVATLLVENDEKALHVAYELANVAPVEVWRGGIFVGEVQRPITGGQERQIFQ